MRAWYFPQLQRFKPVAGFESVFTNEGTPYQKEWKVTKVIPGRLPAHSWTYKNYPGFSEVTFELFDEDNKNRLKLTHTGIASFRTTRISPGTGLKMAGNSSSATT